jgi:hypothetical protein
MLCLAPCPVFVWGPGLLVTGSCCWVVLGFRSLNAAFSCRYCMSYFGRYLEILFYPYCIATTVLFVRCGGCKKSPRTYNQRCYISDPWRSSSTTLLLWVHDFGVLSFLYLNFSALVVPVFHLENCIITLRICCFFFSYFVLFFFYFSTAQTGTRGVRDVARTHVQTQSNESAILL